MALFKTCCLSLIFIFLSLIVLISAVASIEKEHFRKILGIKHKASNMDIRDAYKRLIKEWHPDKSDHPNALYKFLEIQKAYEHLMHENGPEYIPFQETTQQYLQKYLSFYRTIQITEEELRTKLLLKSMTTPIVIVIYHDQCYHCALLVDIYRTLIEIFKNAGMHFVAVNSHTYPELTKEFGLRPDYAGLMLLMEMRFATCQIKQSSTDQAQSILNFIGATLKRHISIESKTDSAEITSFLENWRNENRVRVLIVAPAPQQSIDLIYLVAAFTWRSYIDFCYVPVEHVECSSETRKRFQLVPQLHTLLIFHEDSEHPVARLVTNDTTKSLLWPLLKAHQYPQLPRLRTQQMLEDLCPTAAVSSRPKLCVMLTWDNTKFQKLARNVLRDLAKTDPMRMRFVYLHARLQRPFIEAVQQQSIDKNFPGVMVIWRWNNSELAFEPIQNINWTNRHALLDDIKHAAERLVKSCWNACSTHSVPHLFNELQHVTLMSLLMNKFNAFCRIVKELTPILLMLVAVAVLRILNTYFTAIETATLLRQRNSQLLLAIYLKSLLTFMQIQVARNRAQLEPEFGHELLLIIAQRRSSQKLRNTSFMQKLALRFGTLRWVKTTRRPKRLRRVRHPRAYKLRRCSKKRIGSIFPQNKHAKLSIYCKKSARRDRQAYKTHNYYRYTQWFLVLIPRSFSMENVPQMSLN